MKYYSTLAFLMVFNVFASNGGINLDNHDNIGDMRAMTFNIRRQGRETIESRKWENRSDAVIKMVKDEIKPDIIGMQEVAAGNQKEELKEKLSQTYRCIGDSRGSSWNGRGTDEYTPIFYNYRKLDVVECGTFPVNDWQSSNSWMLWKYGVLPRICTWARFQDKKTKQECYVYNTHLDHKFSTARVNQIKAITHHIKDRIPDIPVIVMGDFNEPLYRTQKETTDLGTALFCKSGLSGIFDSKAIADIKTGPQKTQIAEWSDKKKKSFKTKTIDYIVVKPTKMTILQHTTMNYDKLSAPLSDHVPVYIDIKWQTDQEYFPEYR